MIPIWETEEKDKKTRLIMGQNRPILPHDTPQKPNLWIFPGIRVPIHTRRHLEKYSRKISAKSFEVSDKINALLLLEFHVSK